MFLAGSGFLDLDVATGAVSTIATEIVDETGAVRPHVSVFVDGAMVGPESGVSEGAEIRILQAVSGG